jgi:hypothetical protein
MLIYLHAEIPSAFVAHADGGFNSNFNDQTATVKIYKKPAGAPDAYYSLEKSGSGNTVDLTIDH